MIPFEEALELLHGAVRPLDCETVEAARSLGRVLAEAVPADRDFPPTDRSAMDGYALRAADAAAPGATLRVAGEVRAGEPGDVSLEPGSAVRVFTGAVVPPGADAVVMVERTREDAAAGTVTLDVAVRAGEHVRPRGQDLKRGASVLEPGARIDAAEIAALAAVGCTAPTVYRRPRVRVVSTGDELVEPGERPAAHQVRNSNGPMLLACLAELGIEGELLGNAPDEPRALAKLLRRASDGDALLISGGVSVGRYDLVRGALEDAGMRTLFHGVAMKPGKPVLAGLRDGCLVLGLPGNPVSSLAGFALLAAPALRRMMGYRRPDNVTLNARLERAIRTRPGRKTFHLARVESVAGELSACRAASTGSGDVLSMSRANGWIVSETDEGELAAGDRVPVMLWRDFHLRRHPG